jgi:hypothetical protein
MGGCLAKGSRAENEKFAICLVAKLGAFMFQIYVTPLTYHGLNNLTLKQLKLKHFYDCLVQVPKTCVLAIFLPIVKEVQKLKYHARM